MVLLAWSETMLPWLRFVLTLLARAGSLDADNHPAGFDSPDVVEVGNTQAPAFTTVGTFMDLTDKHELGGDDLLPGFVGVGSTDGKFYAVPYYTGSRLVFYHKDMFAVAGLSVPKTFDEYVAGRHHTCKEEPGRLGHLNVMPYIWEAGGKITVEKAEVGCPALLR
ncbi:hypothetical protein BKA62DRAFT_799042 [Auriculariales sp. MPI-PUGE-AT-0066]|nr:hypothetical protein BKA62DRAFT_799042 [Auriculariales sp. MPI-PUGE-AT-0066]